MSDFPSPKHCAEFAYRSIGLTRRIRFWRATTHDECRLLLSSFPPLESPLWVARFSIALQIRSFQAGICYVLESFDQQGENLDRGDWELAHLIRLLQFTELI